MATRPVLFLTLLGLIACSTTAQKTPFKREVDGLFRFFKESARKNHALGDGTCRMTAQVLTAMARSHRGYLYDEGPYTRNPANFLITCRQSDGSFADPKDADAVETTRWVLDALRSLAPETFEAEVTAGEKWLKAKGSKLSAFDQLRGDKAGIESASRSVGRGPIMADSKPDMGATVSALLTLVRAQCGQPGLEDAKALADGSPKPVKEGASKEDAEEIKKKLADAKTAPWSKVQQRGFEFLIGKQDKGKFYMLIPMGKDGALMKHHDLGLTGIGIASLLTKPKHLRTPKEQRIIDYGLEWIAKNQNARGGFGTQNVNYTTCACVMALAKAKRKEFKEHLDKAQRFIKALQSVEDKDYAPSDRDYGSIGYGGDERGDMSNTQFAVQAAKDAGLPSQDDLFARARVFLERTQNLKGAWSGKMRDPKTGKPVKVITGNDGGSAYYPGSSPAGYIDLPDGSKIPRSYGSMTYALLKTYTLCGVEGDDPRVVAAVKWIEKNFDLDVNPGSDPRLGEKARFQGLYYYYMVMAQALDVAGIDALNVPRKDVGTATVGTTDKVDWRELLKAKLASLQNKNGGWLNSKNGRWWEESDLVCSTYAMLALERCK